jgi:hypothetical protein
MMMCVEQSVEWELAMETDVLEENYTPEPLCPPQIPHGLPWYRNHAATVESRRLTT